ncbi:MAG: hypothetical protein P1U77_27070 [Rubripirellula sp.]|nr:hypothetical protein [Rubripirellula sp.]
MIHTTLEQQLANAAGIWKWQRVIKATAIAISVGLTAALSVGVLIHLGWIEDSSVAITTLVVIALLNVLGWLVGIVISLDRRLKRRWLAESVENGEPLLMDRLNAVVELEHRPTDLSAKMYREPIERQATEVLRKNRQRSPFPWFNTVIYLTVMFALLLGTIRFYQHYQPFQLLAAKQATKQAESSQAENQLAIPEPSFEEQNEPDMADASTEPWGQIRISEPGRNLRLTKYEEVPLMIEAASDRPLSEVYWETSVNQESWGTSDLENAETKHNLPLAEDPRYGVFQPTLKPSELGMSTWDLAIYRAVAQTDDESKYESTTYFVEIIPSRDQLDDLPESAIERLEEISDLILQQQQVIRNTEPLKSKAGETEIGQMDALARQEGQLAMSAETARSAMQQRLPFDATESFDSAMQAARRLLQQAETVLDNHEPIGALEMEQLALMKLVEARRELSHLVEQHPEAFDQSTVEAIEQERLQGATLTDPRLAALMDRLDRETQRTAAVAEQMESLAAKQEQLVDQLPVSDENQYPALTAEQDAVQQQFESLQQTFEHLLGDLTSLSAQAETSLSKSSESLRQEASDAETAAQQAADNLNQLAEKLSERAMGNELLQKNTLKERLQINRSEYQAIQDSPDQSSPESITQTTEETQNLVDQLQRLADKQSTDASDDDSANRSELAEQLTPKFANELNEKCDAIRQTANETERSAIANTIGKSLEKLVASLGEEMLNQESKLDQQQVASNLRRMQQQNESMQAAREAVQKTLLEQQAIERTAFTDRSLKKQYSQLARQQLDLQQQMQQAIEKYPAPFQQTQPETRAATSAMQQTSRSLDGQQPDAPEMADQAAKQLQELDNALEKHQQQQGISEKQRIGEMLERLQKRVGEMAKSPQKVTDQQKQTTAAQCKDVGAKACEMAGPNPGGSNPGGSNPGGANPGGGKPSGDNGDEGGSPPNGQPPQATAGSPDSPANSNAPNAPQTDAENRQQQLNAASDRLAESKGEDQTGSAASDLQKQLQSLAEALGVSQASGQRSRGQGKNPSSKQGQPSSKQGQPSSKQGQPSGEQGQPSGLRPRQANGQNRLRPGGQQAIQRGLAQLESAARQANQGKLSQAAKQTLQQGGVADLLAGIQSQYGGNENARSVALRLAEQLQDPTSPVDLKTLQDLREQIQTLQQDLTVQTESQQPRDTSRRVDPSRFPPAYRESIQKYFETLSEQQ